MAGGFDPKAYLDAESGGGFDPHAYLAEGDHGMDVADTSGAGQAALEHFGNAASMGYLPQLQALAGKLMPDPNAALDARLKAQGFDVRQPQESYVANRDANIARMSQQERDFPIASAAGTGAGVLAGGMAMSPLAGARAATAAGRIAQGVKTGALMGALANPGDTEGEIDPIQAGERYANAKTGALTGGAVSTAIEAVPLVTKAGGYLARKVGAAVSGVPQAEIDNYAARTDQINKLIRDSGGDMTDAADKVRREVSGGIQKTKTMLRGQVDKALEAAPDQKMFGLDQVLAPLEKQKSALLARHQTEEAAAIDGIIGKVKQFGYSNDPVYGVSGYTGKVTPKELNSVKAMLQDVAAPSYQQSGQIFNYSKDSQIAAKYAGAQARKALNGAFPDIAQANNQLSALHRIEGDMNKNLIAAGKSDSALFAAGAGGNARNAKMLQRLGDASGVDALGKAKDLATARTFASPDLISSMKNGRALIPAAIAAGAGHALGPVGYLAGAAASPMAVKGAINVANAFNPAAKAVQAFARNNPALLQRVANAIVSPPENRESPAQFDDETLGVFRKNPLLIDSVTNPQMRSAIMKQLGRKPADSRGSK